MEQDLRVKGLYHTLGKLTVTSNPIQREQLVLKIEILKVELLTEISQGLKELSKELKEIRDKIYG